jgi:YggT family protein
MTMIAAVARADVASIIGAVIGVYVLLIIIYVLVSLVFAFGARLPYNRGVDTVFGFLRDVCEPYLRIFRRFIPPIGPLDVSPVVAILVLQIGGGLVVNSVHG